MPRKERDEKRRDNKGRLLKSGESQRSDGRYAYKYINTFGEPQFVYSWKLVPTDKVPAGKRPCLSLREKIKQIQKDLDDGIDTIGKKMTVCQLYEKYTRQRGNVRKGTQKSRQQLMKLLSEDKLGAASIDSVKLSDAKEWALRMQEKGVAYNTICNSKRSLKAIFYMAVQDDCLRKNPFDFQINEVINDDTVPKVPLTPTQENELLDFMQNDPVYAKYYDEVVILLETGLRISELCGLTPADLNFEKRFVNVDHQLLRSTEDGYYTEAPKTESGFRQVPMSAAAYEAFERVLKKRRDGRCIEVDGYKDFLFLNRDGLPKTAVNYDAMFKCLAKKYNKCHKEPLPDVMTPHTMRHTFCTRMANAGMNPKALQYIMGHANIVILVMAWEEYFRWDEDDTMVAIYYNEDDEPCGYMVYLISSDVMHIKELIYLNREAQLGLWEYIHAHDSMIDEVRGNNYYSEPIAFELDDSDIKETIRPYAMGRIIDVAQFISQYNCDPDGPSGCFSFEIADDLLPWNNGTFVIDFEKGHCALTDKNPQYHLSMSIGTFTTLLLGYKSAEKLLQMGKIQTTYDAVAKLDDILYHEIPYVSDYI